MPTMLIPLAGLRDDRVHADIQPDKWNDWIALGGAIAAGLAWLWRNTIKAFLGWIWNGIRAPQRIEEILVRLDRMQHDLYSTIGMTRATWDSLPTPVWQSDSLGMCCHVNLTYREVLGYQLSEVIGLQWKQVIYPDDKEMVYEEWESAVKDKRPFDLRYRWISKAGKVIPVHAHASPIHNAKNEVNGWVAFVTLLPEGTIL